MLSFETAVARCSLVVPPVFRPEVIVTAARVLWARYILLVFMKYIRIDQTLFLVKIFFTF